MSFQTYGGRKIEVNHGYRDHSNCSLVIVRRRWRTLLGDGRRMGNRPHRINYCRSGDRVSLEWLSWKARPAPLIFGARSLRSVRSTLADSEPVARCKMCCAPSVLLPTGIKASWPHHEWKHILSS